MSLPMVMSLLDDTEATCTIFSLLSPISLVCDFRLLITAITALSTPLLRSIGLAPAVTFFSPVFTIDWASTVAVVVPSPARSLVLEATSFTICAPIFSTPSSSSISLATVTPSLVIIGEPNDFSMMTLRPLGPSVTFTASDSASTPCFRPSLALRSKMISLAIVLSFYG